MNAVSQYEPSQDVATRQNNPFASSTLATRATNNAVADAGQQREIAEVQGAMIIAKRFPRNPIEAMDKILQACTRPTLAEGALYSYSKGGSDVTGPSIRLAEVAAQAWGNVQFGIRELEQRVGESTVEAFAWDIETNTRQVKVFQVRHIRHTRQGTKKLEDPRDVYELVANQGARRLRACILGVIPGDVIETAVKQCEETLRASADTSPEAIKKLQAAFEPFGVTKEQIEKRIQCRIEAIRPAQIVQMKKIYASLRDGMSGPADWFEETVQGEVQQQPASASLRDKVKQRAGSAAKAPAGPGDGLTKADVLAALQAATDVDALDSAYDMASLLPGATQQDREQITAAYNLRRDALDL